MSGSEKANPDLQTIIRQWLKTGNPSGAETEPGRSEHSSEQGQKAQAERLSKDAYFSMMRTFQAVSSAMSEPPVLDALFRSANILPDIVSTFVITGLKGYFALHQQVIDKMGKIGSHTDAYSFDNIDQEALRVWSEIYKNEIRQYFNVPQLGLSRLYQERVNQALDKFNIFSSALAEFLQLLSLPFEKSFRVLQEKIEELTRTGSLPEDSRGYYQMWVKILEGHFMTLFQSPEYNKSLGETMIALEDYISARNRILQDMLQSMPVPTRKEMDDLYKEIYLLKKKVRDLEKANGKQ